MNEVRVVLGLFLLLVMTSCSTTKEIEQTAKTTVVIKDLSGKWKLNNSLDYVIFEDSTQKMIMKSSCGLLTSTYIKIEQALIFNHLKQYNSSCEISQNLIENLQKTVYFKVNSSNQITFYDESHQERLILKKANESSN